jgi:hypothetical protein
MSVNVLLLRVRVAPWTRMDKDGAAEPEAADAHAGVATDNVVAREGAVRDGGGSLLVRPSVG